MKSITLDKRIDLVLALADYLKSGDKDLIEAKEKAALQNPWFHPLFIDTMVKSWTKVLKRPKIESWIEPYKFYKDELQVQKSIGLILAGNIPMVGLHDIISVFISGHKSLIKLSSKDTILIECLFNFLISIEPAISERITFVERISEMDAVIATGSNQSGQVFKRYFSKYPNIIRTNRTGVAILTSNETREEIDGLADDIFLYFGLGCRNITKLYLPFNYDLESLLKAFARYQWMIDHNAYKNNYDYNKTLLLLNKEDHYDSGFAIFRESENLFAPPSVVNFSYVEDIELTKKVARESKEVQVIACRKPENNNEVGFGKCQFPDLPQFADGVDTLKFLQNL